MNILKGLERFDNLGTVKTIDAGKLTEKEFYKLFVDTNTPCLIKGAIKHWPAIKSWRSLEYFKNQCGEYDVPFSETINLIKHVEDTKIKFKKALKSFQLSSSKDILSVPAVTIPQSGVFSILNKDLDGFKFLNEKNKAIWYPNRFFVYRNAGTAWHSHPCDETLMCQVKGAKRVGLFSSDNSYFSEMTKKSEADDYQNGSEFLKSYTDRVKFYIVTCNEGDALYIPPFWSHATDPVGSSIGITVAKCFRSPMHKVGDLRFPQVRELWSNAFKRPSVYSFPIVSYFVASLFAQFVRKIKVALS